MSSFALQDAASTALLSLMEAESESRYKASWYYVIEYLLWDEASADEPETFSVNAMRTLAETCNGWWTWEDDGPVLVPLTEWEKRYQIWKGSTHERS